MTTKVPVPKGLLAGLVGIATVAVLGVVFLLGRLSGPSPVPSTVPGAPTGPPVPLSSAQAQAMPSAPSLGATPATPPPVSPVAPAAQAGTSSPPVDPERRAVQAYFQAVARAQPTQAGDPETVAQGLLAGFGRGDASGFETMVQQARTTREGLAAIKPPLPCADFHRESLAILDDNLELMKSLRGVLAATDPNAQAPDLTTRATALKARTEALQARERTLRQRYNLEAAP